MRRCSSRARRVGGHRGRTAVANVGSLGRTTRVAGMKLLNSTHQHETNQNSRERPILLAIFATTLLAANLHAQSWLTNGLVAYYPFNGNANDASGNGRHGGIHG